MANIITNILTINGTTEDVTKVREFIKGANGETISFQSFLPMPDDLNGEKDVELMMGISFPDWYVWRVTHWSTKWDAMPVSDEAVDAPNRIIFNTADATPIRALKALSLHFPEVTFHVIFSDEFAGQFAGEYIVTDGEVTKKFWFDVALSKDDVFDEAMEYYFRTHEYDRENWKKDEDGEWVSVYDDDNDE